MTINEQKNQNYKKEQEKLKMFTKKVKTLRKNFSLIELLIVIGIMGALTALILPQFQDAEDNAKDTGCDYNNSGTLRYVTMFRAANGVYPNGFHTGLNASDAATTVQDSDGNSALVDATADNFTSSGSAALTETEANSLRAAGITSLAYGTGTADTSVATGVYVNTIDTTAAAATNITLGDGSYAIWSDDGEEFTINGKGLEEWAAAGSIKPLDTASDPAGVIVPLFAAPTIDWETAYDSDGNVKQESPVSIALEGKCPWPEDGKFRYYICLFKVYDSVDSNGDPIPARLIGTACPECGSLKGSDF